MRELCEKETHTHTHTEGEGVRREGERERERERKSFWFEGIFCTFEVHVCGSSFEQIVCVQVTSRKWYCVTHHFY